MINITRSKRFAGEERRDETPSATAGRAFNPTASTQLVGVHGERCPRAIAADIKRRMGECGKRVPPCQK